MVILSMLIVQFRAIMVKVTTFHGFARSIMTGKNQDLIFSLDLHIVQ